MLKCAIFRDILLLQLHCEPITLLADVEEVSAGLHRAEDSGDGEAAGKEDLDWAEDSGDAEAADAGAPLHPAARGGQPQQQWDQCRGHLQ